MQGESPGSSIVTFSGILMKYLEELAAARWRPQLHLLCSTGGLRYNEGILICTTIYCIVLLSYHYIIENKVSKPDAQQNVILFARDQNLKAKANETKY